MSTVLTLSGFDAGNPLRSLGNANLYVPNDEYGCRNHPFNTLPFNS